MRYMKHVETGAVVQVAEDDDEKFDAVKAVRLDAPYEHRHAYVQTGAHDPAVAEAIAAGTVDLVGTLPSSGALVDTSKVAGSVHEDGTVTAIEYVPEAGITGADSPASRTITLVNKGQDGSGTTVVGTLALTAGVNATAFDAKALTLTGTAANKKVKSGDVLAAVSTHVGGTGLADPGGRVRVVIDPD